MDNFKCIYLKDKTAPVNAVFYREDEIPAHSVRLYCVNCKNRLDIYGGETTAIRVKCKSCLYDFELSIEDKKRFASVRKKKIEEPYIRLRRDREKHATEIEWRGFKEVESLDGWEYWVPE